MYSENDTKIMVYNVRRCPKKGDWKTMRKNIKKYDTKRRTLNSRLYYSSCAEDDFYILYSKLFFQTTHDRYLLFKIRLVLSPTLYKFIVWVCWARTQSCFKVQAITDPYRFSFKLTIKNVVYNYT